MSQGALLDTGFLITLFDETRECHESAKVYYKYFLDNQITMYVPTVVISEFSIKKSFMDMPVRNFTILPFNISDALRCATLDSSYYRKKLNAGQRDAVKDDFKILAQAHVQDVDFLVTEDERSMKLYCDALKADGLVAFKAISLRDGFDVSFVNVSGQREF